MKTDTGRLHNHLGVTLTILLALTLAAGACGGNSRNAGQASSAGERASSSAQTNPAGDGRGATSDPAKLDEEIAGLERQAERNPADTSVQEALAQAYVRRANVLRDAGRFREALNDYRRAQRINPDNEEAQNNAAAISPQVEGTPTGEYGEPAPLPISPNVTSGDDEEPSPQNSQRAAPGATATPGRKDNRH